LENSNSTILFGSLKPLICIFSKRIFYHFRRQMY
jgi:hypothetical protein